jgi:hypothetical protein
VRKLLENGLLQYTSNNIIELTEIGINYLSDFEKKDVEEENLEKVSISEEN